VRSVGRCTGIECKVSNDELVTETNGFANRTKMRRGPFLEYRSVHDCESADDLRTNIPTKNRPIDSTTNTPQRDIIGFQK
jgi:hypothetical protein